MIGRVRGRLRGADTDRIEIMTEAGLGYDLRIPSRLVGDLPREGQELELHTVLVVRDDALELFGFANAADRELFRRLQSASGVGPRLALAILGAFPAGRIVRAIRERDYSTLQVVSGVGRKLAEKIVVELADKLEDLAATLQTAGAEGVEGAETQAEIAAVDALRALGYGQMESEKAVALARSEMEGRAADTEEIVRAALRTL